VQLASELLDDLGVAAIGLDLDEGERDATQSIERAGAKAPEQPVP
jgi:hypothetical protein